MQDVLERAIIRKFQADLPLVPQPYKFIADELGISEERLLDKLNELHERKILRRISTVLHHRTVGFKANAMVVWCVPKNRIKEVTDIMISFPQISHCYERKSSIDWPYNIYTMIHSESVAGCEAIISQIMKTVGKYKYEVLYSSRELKKSSMKYFTD